MASSGQLKNTTAALLYRRIFKSAILFRKYPTLKKYIEAVARMHFRNDKHISKSGKLDELSLIKVRNTLSFLKEAADGGKNR